MEYESPYWTWVDLGGSKASTSKTEFDLGRFKNLSADECQSSVNNQLLHKYTNILVITNATIEEQVLVSSILSVRDVTVMRSAKNNSISEAFRTAVGKYCLAEPAPLHCAIVLHPGMLTTVVFCVVAKLACLLAIFVESSFHPILTIGDAIETFMQHPEHETQDFGPITEDYVHKNANHHCTNSFSCRHCVASQINPMPEPSPVKRRHWFAAVCRVRWVVCSLM